jgi:c-di-GMP-binding flagellar brake protein YcgR
MSLEDDILSAFGAATAQKKKPAPASKRAPEQRTANRIDDRRGERRFPLRLKLALVYHQHADSATRPTFHGVTHDVSLSGLSMVLDHNVFTQDEVTLLLAIPPEHHGGPRKIVEVTARMVYTVFSSEHDAFRIGLRFKAFKRNGKEQLKAATARCAFVGEK